MAKTQRFFHVTGTKVLEVHLEIDIYIEANTAEDAILMAMQETDERDELNILKQRPDATAVDQEEFIQNGGIDRVMQSAEEA